VIAKSTPTVRKFIKDSRIVEKWLRARKKTHNKPMMMKPLFLNFTVPPVLSGDTMHIET
jgi:hypothetical protein